MSPLPSDEGAASAQANPEMLGNFDIGEIMNSKGDIVQCVLLPASSDYAKEISIDTTPKAASVQKVLGGPISFLGQYEDEGVVVMSLREQGASNTAPVNKHKLQPPLHKVQVKGDIVIMKVADEGSTGSFFLPYTLSDFKNFSEKSIEEFEVKANGEELAKDLLLAKGNLDEDEDEDSESEVESVEGESDSDDEGEGEDMIGLLMANMMQKFKSMHGREPSEEELKNIGDALKEKFGVVLENDDENENEDEDDVEATAVKNMQNTEQEEGKIESKKRSIAAPQPEAKQLRVEN